jgi:hypothetical protein
MKKYLFFISLFFPASSFAIDDFNWLAAKNSNSKNCNKIIFLKESGDYSEINKEHLNLTTKCVMDILEENGH